MGRAQLRVEVSQAFAIDGVTYRVAEHPALPGIPYVQRGARGFVIQLVAPNAERMALKYFKLKYRVPELTQVAAALRQFADLPGLRAARRTVFTAQTHPKLIEAAPALEYGMLMPWLPGLTWYDLITTRAPLLPAEGLALARRAAQILAELEARGVAHCDIAGANVMIERKAGLVELVDIEEMYGAGMPAPVEPPGGQDGYQHRDSRANGQWRPEGDRFAAAVLIAEMLGWTNGRIRVNSADEHYFAASEMQDPDSLRFRLLAETIQDDFSPALADLLRAAWHSRTLADCPPLAEWHAALEATQIAQPSPQPDAAQSTQSTEAESAAAPPRPASPVISGRRGVSGPGSAERGQTPAAPGDRLVLDGTRLCRNCGAANSARESFCARCGFYIGTGARKPVAVMLPMDRAPGAPGQAPAKAAPVPPPQVVKLNRDLGEIVSARRMGEPGGKGLTRVETPKPPEEKVEANAGSFLVVAILIGLALAVLALVALAG